jgi:hypothetical protein
MLGGNQADVENDAQVTADGRGHTAGKAFVELVDGAQLLASDLSGLADVPGLDHRAGGGGGSTASARFPYHVIDFCLVKYFFHGASSLMKIHVLRILVETRPALSLRKSS